MNLLAEARAFATKAHEGQTRKYTGEPYIKHPETVASILLSVGMGSIHFGEMAHIRESMPAGKPELITEEVLAAAMLHDVVEDCGVTFPELTTKFGTKVSTLVYWLTDVSTKADGNRAKRKALDRDHLSMAPVAAKTIKLADMIDNSISIWKHDPDFAKVYFREKKALLEVLKEGDPFLHALASALVEDYFKSEEAK